MCTSYITLGLFFIHSSLRSTAQFDPSSPLQCISRNDAKFNTAMSHQKDTIISAHTMMRIGRENYTIDELEAIKRIKEINKRNI